MSLLNVVQYAKNRGITLRGEDHSPERLDHLEELRQRMWREIGYELVGGKWRKTQRTKESPVAAGKKKTIRERIEALVYYGPGDEASEMFCRTCEFSYHLAGAPAAWQEYVCAMAEDMAKLSREEYARDGGNPDDPKADVIRGRWGPSSF